MSTISFPLFFSLSFWTYGLKKCQCVVCCAVLFLRRLLLVSVSFPFHSIVPFILHFHNYSVPSGACVPPMHSHQWAHPVYCCFVVHPFRAIPTFSSSLWLYPPNILLCLPAHTIWVCVIHPEFFLFQLFSSIPSLHRIAIPISFPLPIYPNDTC